MNLKRKGKGLLVKLRHSLRTRHHRVKKHFHRRFNPASLLFQGIDVSQWGF